MNLYDLLHQLNYSITSAESCTGGLVSSKIVDFGGISEHFKEGYITYAEEAKSKLLSVPPELITEKGVVSEEVAKAMAIGAAACSGADCAISTTGLAGPSGGSKECPVGTVCFGFVIKNQVTSVRMLFSGNRQEIREKAADFAIHEMEQLLSNCLEKGE